jgi:replication factor A1
MYVEIPPDSIPILKPQLKEGKIVVMKKFVVEQAKPEYRVVPNPYMLRLNKRTMITTVEPEPSMFPKVTYMLTPLSELEQYKGSTERFLGMHKYF